MSRRVVATAALSAVGAFVGALAPSAAAASSCYVVTGSGEVLTSLQLAVSRAEPGDVLTVEGICVGSAVVQKDLVVVGHGTAEQPTATLAGDGWSSVLQVTATVELRDLRISGGGGVLGGGISNYGTVTLVDTAVTDNVAERGGGISNQGTVRMTGTSTVARNVVLGSTGRDGSGAGIRNRGVLVLQDTASVAGNDAGSGGTAGGVANIGGEVVLEGSSSVVGNVAGDDGGFGAGTGGGIASEGGAVHLRGASTVADNEVGGAGDGGGVYASGAEVTIEDQATVQRNSAGGYGGGVFARDGSLTVGPDASVAENEASPAPESGGGIYADGTVLDLATSADESAVSDNDPDDVVAVDVSSP